MTAIDRKVRGSARTVDIVAMLAQPGNRLLLHEDQGYAVAKDERIVTLGARQEDSAALVLRAMLAEAPAGETIEINWLTSAQQWAVREVVAAGIELRPYGPVMVRGMDGPPSPVHPERRVRLSQSTREFRPRRQGVVACSTRREKLCRPTSQPSGEPTASRMPSQPSP